MESSSVEGTQFSEGIQLSGGKAAQWRENSSVEGKQLSGGKTAKWRENSSVDGKQLSGEELLLLSGMETAQ